MATRIAPSADVSPDASLGDGASIWHLAQVREHARIGAHCIVGRGAYIGEGVTVGDNCKIQNYALIYEPASLADGVFIGPAVTLTNDHFPRAVTPEGQLKSASDWEPVGVTVEEGASIGARAVCVAPVTIGAWATVAAGAVVTKDVPAHALVAGVPARRIGWVGRAGVPLEPAATPGQWRCPSTGQLYEEVTGPAAPGADKPSAQAAPQESRTAGTPAAAVTPATGGAAHGVAPTTEPDHPRTVTYLREVHA